MPTPSKFTADVRALVLEALGYGADRLTACQYAGIDPTTFRRWLKRGETARAGSLFRKFRDDVMAAEAEPKIGALKAVRSAWPDKPELAWKFVERRVPGFAPPMPDRAPAATQQVVILTLDDGRPLAQPALRPVENEAESSDQQAG